MRALIFALSLVAGSCFANAPWVANYEQAKVLLPAISDESSATAKAWRKEVNRMLERGRTDNEIPLDAARRVLARMHYTPTPTAREQLVAAEVTSPTPVVRAKKPVVYYSTGGGNMRGSDGTVILRTGDAITVYPPK
jgi:hypothetical protein